MPPARNEILNSKTSICLDIEDSVYITCVLHAQTKLEDAGVSLLPALPVHLDKALQQQRAQQPTPGGRHLELTCLGQVPGSNCTCVACGLQHDSCGIKYGSKIGCQTAATCRSPALARCWDVAVLVALVAGNTLP